MHSILSGLSGVVSNIGRAISIVGALDFGFGRPLDAEACESQNANIRERSADETTAIKCCKRTQPNKSILYSRPDQRLNTSLRTSQSGKTYYFYLGKNESLTCSALV